MSILVSSPGHRASAANERGAVLVIVAVWLTSALGLMVFVVDVGHWFEHKRHLQLQVDAGALAAGSLFNKCLAVSAADRADKNSTANLALDAEARKYAGDTNKVATAYNPQVNNKANVTILLNSDKYANNGGTDYSDPAGPPCQSEYVDLKGTDANLPWFFDVGLVPAINAHARVSILQISTLVGSLPLAVQDVNPAAAAAIFVNEDNASYQTDPAAVLATTPLTNTGAQTLNGRTLLVWDNIGAPVGVNVQTKDTGVIIALSGKTTWSLAGSVSTICGQIFVTCLAYNGTSYSGLQLIHGYSTTGTGSATTPILRDVQLSNVTCGDTSAPNFVLNGNCTIGVQAKIDFGATPVPAGAQVKVAPGNGNQCPNSGQNPKGCPMTYNSTTGYWETTTSVTITSAGSGIPIDLNWGTTAAGNNHTFTQVARPFSASDDSGPIEYARVTETGVTAGSLAFGTHNLSVAVGIAGNLQNASSASDPTVILRFASGAASNSGALDCDAGVNSQEEIQNGCKTAYSLNPGQACVAANTPPYCVATQTGNFTGQLRNGMNARFTPCPDNNWVTTGLPAGTLPDIPAGDPRAIPLIITTFGAFSNNGTGRVPVINFGMFYVTGWDQGGGGPCEIGAPPKNEPFPGPGSQNGDVWGHFMKYVGSLPGSSGGSTCDFSSFAPCIPVLTD